MSQASFLLVDPNKLFREGMKAIFRREDFRIMGEAGTLDEAVRLLAEGAKPDIILIDTPALGQGREEIGRLHEWAPESRVVVLTSTLDPQALADAIQAGADGYLIKDVSSEALGQSLRLVLLGEKVLPTDLAQFLISGRLGDGGTRVAEARKGLSPRELQILHGLLKGNSNKRIALDLAITEATVKVHLKSLLRKINCTNRTQAAIWALNNGIGDDRAVAAAE